MAARRVVLAFALLLTLAGCGGAGHHSPSAPSGGVAQGSVTATVRFVGSAGPTTSGTVHFHRCGGVDAGGHWIATAGRGESCVVARGLLKAFFRTKHCSAGDPTVKSCEVTGRDRIQYICDQFVKPTSAPFCSAGDLVVSARRPAE